MHFLTRQRLHLARFHPLMKVLLTLYIISVLAGLWVASLKYTDRATWSVDGVTDYVAGSEELADDDPFGGVFAGLEGEALFEGKTRRELVDIVHPHLFSIPILLFVLGHLLHLTNLRDGWKLGINVIAFTSMLTTFLLPFAVIEHRGLAPILYGSGVAMFVSMLALCVIPLWEMWFATPREGFNALPRPPGRSDSRPPDMGARASDDG